MRLSFLLLLIVFSLGARPCLSVAGDEIHAGELAREQPAFRDMDPEAVIGISPAPGVRRVYSARELAGVAAHNNIQLVSPLDEVCFERAVSPLTAEALERAMQSVLNDPDVRIELLDFSRLNVPAGELMFTRTGLAAAASPSTPLFWRGSLRYSPQHTLSVWARVRIFKKSAVLVAAHDLRAGVVIQQNDIAVEVRDVSPFGRPPATKEAALGSAARRTIPAGTVITDLLLQTAPDIAAGDTVRVSAGAGAAVITFDAVARTFGHKGDRIVLINPENQRPFRAVVDGKGRAHATSTI